jgi:hypothetical protein
MYHIEVTYVIFQDNNPAKGLHVFEDGMSLPKTKGGISSIELALRLCYSFGDNYNFNKAKLLKSLGKLHPKIDSLQDQHDHGVYPCKMLEGFFLTYERHAKKNRRYWMT